MQRPEAPLDRRGLLIVSLPRNDRDLARAAIDSGADLLKVHVNVHHRASGTAFGSLQEEMDRLNAILDLHVPTGLVVGRNGWSRAWNCRSCGALPSSMPT